MYFGPFSRLLCLVLQEGVGSLPIYHVENRKVRLEMDRVNPKLSKRHPAVVPAKLAKGRSCLLLILEKAKLGITQKIISRHPKITEDETK